MIIISTKYAFVYTKYIPSCDSCLLDPKNIQFEQDYYFDIFNSNLGETSGEKPITPTMGITFITEGNFLWVLVERDKFNPDVYLTLEELYKCHFSKYLVTNKKIINSLFTEDFSDNLLQISIDRQDFYESLPSNLYYGSQLNYSSEYDTIINTDGVEIISIKFQPNNSESTITFINENLIQFSHYRHETEMRNQICVLSTFFNKNIKDK